MDSLHINIEQPDFTHRDKAVLTALQEKYVQYRAQGRDLEAMGMGRAAHIAWAVMRGDFAATQPTNWSAL
jgi:hypothetical protein